MRTGVPQVENAVDTLAKLENSRAVSEAVNLYENLMWQSVTMPVLDDAEISRTHNEILQKAIDCFLSKAIKMKSESISDK